MELEEWLFEDNPLKYNKPRETPKFDEKYLKEFEKFANYRRPDEDKELFAVVAAANAAIRSKKKKNSFTGEQSTSSTTPMVQHDATASNAPRTSGAGLDPVIESVSELRGK